MPRPPIIPRSTLVEYQRWELTNFERQAELTAAATAPPPSPPGSEESPISKEGQQATLDAELATARDKGRCDGFAQGFQDDFERGHRQGEEDSKHIATFMQSVRETIDQLNSSVAGKLADLVLQLTQQFLHGVLHTQPERILPLIREVLGDAPTASASAMLCIHADDAALVRQTLGTGLVATGWTLIVDTTIGRGGCRMQTRFDETDATLQARWAESTRALGHDIAWPADEHAEAERTAGDVLHVA